MRIVFAGPSIYPSAPVRTAFPAGLIWQAPAQQGDIARAVKAGATAIALIDGLYGTIAAVWHKEILFALSRGVTMIGGASMGALRAAECAPFGMQGVGAVFEAYRSGAIVDDGDVALLHAPAELDHAPMTETLVDMRATLAAMVAKGVVADAIASRIIENAERLSFWDRTLAAVLDGVTAATDRSCDLEALYEAHRVHAKRADALLVLETLVRLPRDMPPVKTWSPSPTRSYRRLAAL